MKTQTVVMLLLLCVVVVMPGLPGVSAAGWDAWLEYQNGTLRIVYPEAMAAPDFHNAEVTLPSGRVESVEIYWFPWEDSSGGWGWQGIVPVAATPAERIRIPRICVENMDKRENWGWSVAANGKCWERKKPLLPLVLR